MKKNLLILLIIICGRTNAQYIKLFDFTVFSEGRFPHGSLISDGTFLYGLDGGGGANNDGAIFKIMPDGTGYVKLLDFASTASGSSPEGSLIFDGTFLYGTTQTGGIYNFGTLFKIKPDGTSYVKLLDFTGAANGKWPYGSLISDGTFMYGMTGQGGTTNNGTIFKIKPDGTGYVKLLDFILGTSGSYPTGSLILDGTFLYGMANAGGANNDGTIFKIKPDGTGFVKLLDFAGSLNGRYPTGSLISDGTFLYGMTEQGGLADYGTIFKIMPNGNGYAKLLDFLGATNGKSPNGSLTFDGPILCGMTKNGGTSDLGTMFKILPDGTGYSKLIDFSGIANGSSPYGDIFSDGTFLYGTTFNGGSANNGTIFKVGIATAITKNNEPNGFNLYPNPSNGTFTIASKENDYILTITNVLGENIYQPAIKNQTQGIDLSKQPNGVYFINIKSEKGTISKKIIVNK